MSMHFELVDLVDLVIAIAAAEFVLLVVYRQATGLGVALHDFLANMLAGFSLMFALRSVAVDAGIVTTGAWLVAAGIAHGTDIVIRWRRDAGCREVVQ